MIYQKDWLMRQIESMIAAILHFLTIHRNRIMMSRFHNLYLTRLITFLNEEISVVQRIGFMKI